MKTVSHIIAATLLTAGVATANEEIRFDEQDANRDGYISQDEWRDAQVDVDFSEVDTNNDGMLTEQELQSSDKVELQSVSAEESQFGTSETTTSDTQAVGTETAGDSGLGEFESQDYDRDGALTESEWQNVDVDVAFDEIDQDQDGRVTAQEIQQSDRIELQDTGAQSGMSQSGMSQSGMSQSGQAQQGMAGSSSEQVDFSSMDSDNDGFLTESEWQNANVDVQFSEIDQDRDGFVSEQDLRQSDKVELKRASAQGEQQQSARDLDRNQDQMIDEQEAAGNDYVVTNFEAWDTDGDGMVEVAVVEEALVEQEQEQSRDASQDDMQDDWQ